MPARPSFLSLALLLPTICGAQELVNARKGAMLYEAMLQEKTPLMAHVYPVRVSLSFNFRFQAGYYFETPAAQFAGSGHHLALLLRVVPAGKSPVFLGTRHSLPDVPDGKKAKSTNLGIGGMFFLGDGEYTIDFLIADERGRVYHSTQKLHARRNGAEKKLIATLAPGAVKSLSSLRMRSASADDSKPLKLTLLLHAAPNYSRSTVFRPQDLNRLLGAMTGLLEQVPVKSLRVVAFNLDQQKELYRNERFEPEAFDKLEQALLPIQLGTVDINVLKNKTGYVDLLAGMISQELHAEDSSETVIVLGPPSRLQDSVRAGVIEENPANGPRFFYFQYHSLRDRGQSQFPDTIESAMKRVGGKVFHIFTAGDFAKALTELKRLTADPRYPTAATTPGR